MPDGKSDTTLEEQRRDETLRWAENQVRRLNAANNPRERIAAALFASWYGDTDDDREFAARLWASLPTKQRRNWYRQADIAIAAIGDQHAPE